ncbi:RagB/SusD family nutrient uptake outer membrane protein [Mucilaginibacter sp. PAMB04274]|uniref:RagB/SusD family nutrient uptake outer membrane protein n=1 Tax=Mucilaginibacter sp. PAMB04274 TaxID=3138568 RepID=UPI0031F61510
MKHHKILIYFCFAILSLLAGCEKFLEEKSQASYAVPEKVSDLQAMLDNESFLNTLDPGAGEVTNPDYYLLDATWSSLSSEYDRRMYAMDRANIFEPANNDWSYVYRVVNIANTVLDALPKVRQDNGQLQWNSVKGQALFFRAKGFLQALGIWSPAFRADAVQETAGIPLRLNSNFNERSVRSSVSESYQQVILDLRTAASLLPNTQITALRPSKAAAFGMLARAYLLMRDYTSAELYADSCLRINANLLSFSSLNAAATFPISRFNTEVVFESYIPSPLPLSQSRAKIVPELYNSYQANDLRKTVFFRTNTDGSFAFKGSYEGGAVLFSGIATDEMYLIRSECRARGGKLQEALDDLNNLLRTRYNTSFAALQIGDQATMVNRIIMERRKELLMRGLNWVDIKRLNAEGRQISITKTINGVTRSLAPNSGGFALPIPEDVIVLSGMEQNP